MLKLNIAAPGIPALVFYDFFGESCPESLIK